ncbi:bifunctional 5,10-methylenetetrahydrofolate dehydrogenase/5,10-methenyltetrahydrofolate cyclohydrolase [Lactobacillus sp. PV034]|uniref:bifunctional 5,10-methylenetetrahydrofolate dehydrogenase/5,10-methenyltetrahydrofolate cyclohydrolase n=1 Tax=Lactobacillus sp. PV034 TaxID=2594495 RepID=UPI0022400FE8|nr:tetrahydrofolate dehydrogenase/cyclohydrolase catalytic domain-containing protein [Lactobacillus sp. PV034]QNQ80259.1 bifunctional methylenetetrahydrofolate dehydrogenase/methenyltetrahydrofolate cyclohydrolase [Lactobacillus sp. PV034]
MTTILDGKNVANQLTTKLQEKVKELNLKNIIPTLYVIEVGEDPASRIYLKAKENLAKRIGIKEVTLKFSENISQKELIDKIIELNRDPKVNGIMVQLPLPKHIDTEKIVATIAPEKDADGFHPYNQGRMWQSKTQIIPATVRGILALLDYYQLDVSGKDAVIIGRSLIVGKPLASQFLRRDATVTIAHSKTKNLADLTNRADIVVSDVGQAHLLKRDMIKENAVLIDVGMNRKNGHLMGDIDYQECFDKASAITPVPGGVGPLTVVSLMQQVLILAENQING